MIDIGLILFKNTIGIKVDISAIIATTKQSLIINALLNVINSRSNIIIDGANSFIDSTKIVLANPENTLNPVMEKVDINITMTTVCNININKKLIKLMPNAFNTPTSYILDLTFFKPKLIIIKTHADTNITTINPKKSLNTITA